MLERYKSKVEAAAVEEDAPKSADERTLNEILKNKEDAALLGKFLARDNKQDLAGRIASASITEADFSELEQYRAMNIQKIEEVQKLDEMLTPEYVQECGARSPEFAKLLKLLGPEKAAKAIKSQLREVVVSDGDRFDTMYASLDKLNQFKSGEMKELEDQIREECERLDLDEKEFADIMALPDTNERKKALRQHARTSYGFFKKAGDFVSFGHWSKADAEKLARNKPEMDEMVEALNNHIKGLGGAMSMLVTENGDVRKAFAREMVDEQAPAKVPEEGFAGIKEDKRRIDAEWAEFKRTKNFDTLSETQQQIAIDDFKAKVKMEKRAQPAKKGIWSRLWSAVFDRAIDDKQLN
jgi:hypothetical protein